MGPLGLPPDRTAPRALLPLPGFAGSRRGPRSIGSDLEYADELTLDRAMGGRRPAG